VVRFLPNAHALEVDATLDAIDGPAGSFPFQVFYEKLLSRGPPLCICGVGEPIVMCSWVDAGGDGGVSDGAEIGVFLEKQVLCGLSKFGLGDGWAPWAEGRECNLAL
jgi:hypothetical protein